LDALEPELRFLDDVSEVTSVAREGSGVISIEFHAIADMQTAQSDVEQAVAQVTTLPDGSEEPVITRAAFFEPVANISVAGPFSETAIKTYANQLRDGLLAADIDRVTFNGNRDEEIWVRIREYDLRRLDLTLSDVAGKIRENTRDLPSGTLEGDVEVQLRSVAERKTPEKIADIEIKSLATGEKIHLRDIAKLETRHDDDEIRGQSQGQTAIELRVYRSVVSDTLQTMDRMNAYLDKVLPTLPKTLEVKLYRVRGKFVKQRLGILSKNGLQGLVLVLIILFIFLNARIAFWVAAGIPVAFMGTLAVMYLSGQTINMVSMFALIMMLGIIVDDAIVVGEHTATRQELGDSRLEAAERGANRMIAPVMAATLTTQAAFFPIFLVSDRIGDIMSSIPLVVVAVLTASIIECFLILPGHLRHGFGKIRRQPSRFRRAFDGGLIAFRDGPYRRFVGVTYRWRYTTVAFTFASLIICIGLIVGGRVGFTFFPSPEPENIRTFVEFGAGTPVEEQTAALKRIDDALRLAEEELGGGKEKLIVNSFITLGRAGRGRGDNLAEINVQLTASEERTILTKTIIPAWRKRLPQIAGVNRIAILGQRIGPPGRDIDVRLQNAPVDKLKAASAELKTALTRFPGVTAIADDLPYGKRELIMELTPKGTALGFTNGSVGTQVRNAFDGAIATRFARGDEEITVRVLRVQETPGTHSLQQIYLRSPDGQRVPLTEIVNIREKAGYSVIQRKDGVRTVAVTADLDPRVTSVTDVLSKLSEDVMPGLVEKYGLDYQYKGRDEERRKSFADLKLGALLALAIIYIILAWVFESYAKPFAVMAIIPFGIVGAILGHLVMGFHLTIISLIGLLGLSGILVNDSIILMMQVRRRLADAQSLAEAAIGASQDRLRAVVLTSLTTIGGLLPLLFETSRQAQFLIPMAITLVFGLASATILVLVLVPALVGVGGDIGRVGGSLVRLYRPSERHVLTPGE
ncbi:MAG: efflux RND transporter permease subunit, partial [Methyloligellaceae bacterium]